MAADDSDALPPVSDLPLEQRAIQVVGGAERVVDAAAARARGLTVVDLSDGWVPRVLADQPGPKGTTLENPYRAIYSGLASDRGDGDGQPLAAGERNYLDLYGIPPTLSVLRRRFLEDSRRTCAADIDADTLLAVDEVPTWGASTEQKELGKRRARAARLEAARVAAGVPTLEALAEKDPRTARDVKEQLAFAAQRAAFAEAEKRLVCEGLMDPAKHKAGSYDTAMRTAMLQFQQKHAVFDQADIKRPTLEALARPPLENDMRALGRVLSERAMHAAGFLEDGSVNDAAAAGRGGELGRRRDLPGGGRHAPPGPGPGDGLARGGAGAPGDRDGRRRRRIFPAPQPGRLRLAEGGGPLAGAARILRPADGPLRRDRSRGRLVRLPVQRRRRPPAAAAHAVPDLHDVREVARRARSARALAHHRRWLARRAGRRRSGVLPVQGVGRRAARLAPHRRRPGLDPAGQRRRSPRW